jgi:SNF2 family DNA or RNA helicase
MKVIVRVGRAGNGTPCFLISGESQELKRPFGASFDQTRQVWMYPAYFPAAYKVLEDFRALSLVVEMSEPAQRYVEQLDKVFSFYKRNFIPEKFSFVTKPFEHQIVGLAHLFYMYRAALFFQQGLGKSKIAVDYIRLLKMVGSFGGALVLGPLVTIQNWGKEIDLHSGNTLKWTGIVGGSRKEKSDAIEKTRSGAFDVVLVTYDSAARHVDSLYDDVPYNTVIADESHLIKDWTSARTKAAYELGQKATRKVIMTGTPTLGSPLDIYGQFRFLADAFIPESYVAYKAMFCIPHASNKHAVVGYQNMDILNARTQFVAIRRTKEECLDLPERLPPIDVEFELSRKQTVIYNELVEEMGLDVGRIISKLGEGKDLPSLSFELPHIAVMLNKLSQISSGFLLTPQTNPAICNACDHLEHCVAAKIKPYTQRCFVVKRAPDPTLTVFDENPKLDALDELLESILGDPENKVIVWCKYTAELDIIERRLQDEGHGFVRVDGKTGLKVQGFVDQFNTDPGTRIYLAQCATGVGITLNAANFTIFYSLDYSLANYEQPRDRNYRIGQKRKVTIYRLLGKHTIDPSIAALLENKVDIDTVLTHKLSCIVCEKSTTCIPAGVQLFDPSCLYKKDMARVVTRARLIGKGDWA